jgi:hypothetical protein
LLTAGICLLEGDSCLEDGIRWDFDEYRGNRAE